MEKTIRRAAAVMIALCMILAALPVTAVFAEDGGIDIGYLTEAMKAAIREHAADIDVSGMGITEENVGKVLNELFETCHAYNFAYSGLNYRYIPGGNVTALAISYKMNREQLNEAFELIDGTIDSIVAGMPAGGEIYEKLLYAHDWLTVNTRYDTTYSVYDAYQLFRDGTGVCDAYTDAFMLICERLGVPCEKVSSDQMKHAWARVQIDGEWYHVDVTWDDPVGDRMGYARHDHFLVSDAMIKTLNHTGFEEGYCASDRFDSAWWRNTESQVVFINGDAYYGSVTDGKVYRVSGTDQSVGEIWSTNATWKAYSSGENSIWPKKYVSVAARRGMLLANTASSIIGIDPATLETETVLEPELESADIYRLFTDKNGDIRYVVAADPNGSSDEDFVLEDESVLWGDLDGSGLIDTVDLTLMRQYLADAGTEIDATAADVDLSGAIDTVDMTMLRQYLADGSVVLGAAA